MNSDGWLCEFYTSPRDCERNPLDTRLYFCEDARLVGSDILLVPVNGVPDSSDVGYFVYARAGAG